MGIKKNTRPTNESHPCSYRHRLCHHQLSRWVSNMLTLTTLDLLIRMNLKMLSELSEKRLVSNHPKSKSTGLLLPPRRLPDLTTKCPLKNSVDSPTLSSTTSVSATNSRKLSLNTPTEHDFVRHLI